MDLECSYVCELTEILVEPERYEAVLEWTTLDDPWRDLDAGDVAALFWEEPLPVLSESYRRHTRDSETGLQITCRTARSAP
jgi:hypothetical protein